MLKTALAAALTAPLLACAPSAPATAAPTPTLGVQGGVVRAATTVCVDSHVGARWQVARAMRLWNAVPHAPRLVRASSCPTDGTRVTIRPVNHGGVYTGWTNWTYRSWVITDAQVTLDPGVVRHRYRARDRACLRAYTTVHELGHALGLEHYPSSHPGSVMSYQGWRRTCGVPDRFDRATVANLYGGAR